MIEPFQINDRLIGPGQPCFIIAEAGVNHNGNLELARQLIDVASDAGANAIKFQTFKASGLVTRHAPKADYQLQTTQQNESQFDMLQHLELSRQDHEALVTHCQKRGILFMSTPFDESSVDMLDELGVPVFKLPSGEVTNWPFLEYVAAKGKPVILSTGMSYLGEVEEAIRILQQAGCAQVAVLHCVTDYPANPSDVNLNAMKAMSDTLQVVVGYSDHTLGIEIALAAVARGALLLEKHFTLDRSLPGPDHKASLEPSELRSMIKSIRAVESALGDGRKQPAPGEKKMADVLRRSLVASRDIAAGKELSREDIAILRPGTGLQPRFLPEIIGRRARHDIPAGTLLSLEMLE